MGKPSCLWAAALCSSCCVFYSYAGGRLGCLLVSVVFITGSVDLNCLKVGTASLGRTLEKISRATLQGADLIGMCYGLHVCHLF